MTQRVEGAYHHTYAGWDPNPPPSSREFMRERSAGLQNRTGASNFSPVGTVGGEMADGSWSWENQPGLLPSELTPLVDSVPTREREEVSSHLPVEL